MKNIIIAFAGLLLVLTGCKRDEYYKDGGKAKADYPGDMLQYLQDKAVPFDTIAQIVKLAGMEETFRKTDFTFFAPDDDVIKRTIGNNKTRGSLNKFLFDAGRDTVKNLSDIDSAIWKKYLQRYMFKGINRLKDYPQIDINLQNQYPGALYYAYSGDVLNIGVIYDDANNIKYIGPRTLVISYIYDINNAQNAVFRNKISSSDIKPKNGVVHTLQYNEAYFGFNQDDFYQEIYFAGLHHSD
ncbi:fasciclin domain-containing protein [Mucilaginibacter celer]|nr:fasciclin domain-containing protein [Mucilaginibacter celer]